MPSSPRPDSGPPPDERASAASNDGTGQRPTPSRWPRRYRVAWLVAGLVVLASLAWVHWTVGGPRTTLIVSDALIAFGALAAALALTRLARTAPGPARRGWRLLAAGAWFEFLGELSWAGYGILAGGAPYPGLPDLLYLAGYPFLAAGFLSLAVDPRISRPWLRFALEGLVVGTALLTIGWHFALQPLLASSPLAALGTWLAIAYPVLDILVASIGFVVAVNERGPRRVALLLVSAGIFAWAVGDITFAGLEFTVGYTFDELALLWLIGDLTIALGALHPDADTPGVSGTRRHYRPIELGYPYLPFLVVVGLVAVLGYRDALDLGDVVLGVLVVAFLVTRQVYISRDAYRLGRELEERERTLATRNRELLLVNRIVRHDIRNDMTVAHGWAQELEGHVDEAGEQMLERILRTTQHTIDLTITLRDFVDALEPDQEASLESTSLREHLLDTVESRRETYPHATVSVDDVSPVAVRANALLATVFRNILNNAVQHNDTDAPEIAVTTDVGDDTVTVRIADNGPGIPDDRKDAVFGRAPRGIDEAGSGIGLYLVDTLVTQYGGDVWVEDNDPRGAVFVVELPLADDDGTAHDATSGDVTAGDQPNGGP